MALGNKFLHNNAVRAINVLSNTIKNNRFILPASVTIHEAITKPR